VAALAHELGHVIDEPREFEPEKGSPEWHERRIEREETAWRIATQMLETTAAWPELDGTVRDVIQDRLARYRAARDRALGTGPSV